MLRFKNSHLAGIERAPNFFTFLDGIVFFCPVCFPNPTVNPSRIERVRAAAVPRSAIILISTRR